MATWKETFRISELSGHWLDFALSSGIPIHGDDELEFTYESPHGERHKGEQDLLSVAVKFSRKTVELPTKKEPITPLLRLLEKVERDINAEKDETPPHDPRNKVFLRRNTTLDDINDLRYAVENDYRVFAGRDSIHGWQEVTEPVRVLLNRNSDKEAVEIFRRPLHTVVRGISLDQFNVYCVKDFYKENSDKKAPLALREQMVVGLNAPLTIEDFIDLADIFTEDSSKVDWLFEGNWVNVPSFDDEELTDALRRKDYLKFDSWRRENAMVSKFRITV